MTEHERQEVEKAIRDQIKRERIAYQREWRRKNKDKVKAANARYYAKHKDQLLSARKMARKQGGTGHV